MSRDLGTSYKTAFVMCHKIREALATEFRNMRVGGEGETVEIDGAYFGGYIKPANLKENRKDRRLAKIRMASAGLSWLRGSVADRHSRPCSRPKVRHSPGSAPMSPRARSW